MEMPRVSAFALVGCAGFVVQLSALEALTVGLGVPHLLATAGAVEVAILHNFAWHERWTWADRTGRAPRQWAARWASARRVRASQRTDPSRRARP